MPFLGKSTRIPENPGGPEDPGSGGTGGPLPKPPVPQFSGLPSITLQMPDGTVYDLSDPRKMLAITGRKGFDGAPYDVFVDESPTVDGEIFRSARARARDLVLPVLVRSDARPDFLDLKRALLARMAPTRGLMTLTVAEPDGTRRHIFCYYVRGAEGDGDKSQTGRNWVRYSLELRAPDPYWRGETLHEEWQAGNAYLFLGGDQSKFLPFRVSSSQTFGETSFENPGDVDSYPIWTIVGPTNGGIVLTRTTADYPTQTISLSSVLSPAQSLTIDTRPDRLTITDNSGANRWPQLDDGSTLWRITPGTNLITVAVGGSNPNTRVFLDAEPRYEAA